MSPYTIPGLKYSFTLLSDDKKEVVIRQCVEEFYKCELTRKRIAYKKGKISKKGDTGNTFEVPSGSSRDPTVMLAKKMYAYLMSKYTNYRQIDIASFLGHKDRTVISYYLQDKSGSLPKHVLIDSVEQLRTLIFQR